MRLEDDLCDNSLMLPVVLVKDRTGWVFHCSPMLALEIFLQVEACDLSLLLVLQVPPGRGQCSLAEVRMEKGRLLEAVWGGLMREHLFFLLKKCNLGQRDTSRQASPR